MSAVKQLRLISVEDYLAGELVSPIKHDYVGGYVYAMAGGTNAHALIAGNVFAILHAGLRGKKCRPFNSDTKIRIRQATHDRFYYPDVSVICRPNPQQDSFQDDPAILVEVVSKSTRRIDFGEKRDAYLTIPSLHAYLLIEQDKPGVVVYRRGTEGFVAESYEGLAVVIALPEIETELPLREIYDGVEFIPEPDTQD